MVCSGTAPGKQNHTEIEERADREIRLEDASRASGFFSQRPAWTQHAAEMVGAGVPLG